jgi:hypothetical protein
LLLLTKLMELIEKATDDDEPKSPNQNTLHSSCLT